MNTMTKFECGCRVMSDCINLNSDEIWVLCSKPSCLFAGSVPRNKWNSNVWKTHLWRWKSNGEERSGRGRPRGIHILWPNQVEGTSQNLPPDERHKVKDVERLRNIANGQMDEIDMAMRELQEEERENKNQPEPENWMKAQNYLKKRLLYIERGDGRKFKVDRFTKWCYVECFIVSVGRTKRFKIKTQQNTQTNPN